MPRPHCDDLTMEIKRRSLGGPFHSLLRSIEKGLEQALQTLSGAVPPGLAQAVAQSVRRDRDRVRALLVHLLADNQNRRRRALIDRYAVAVELVHCASTVHDRLPALEQAARRWCPTLSASSIAEPTALLVGDTLITLAFELLGDCPVTDAALALELTQLLSTTTRQCIGGRTVALQACGAAELSHQLSGMIVAASVGGSILAGSRGAQLEQWRRFGEHVGNALVLRQQLEVEFVDAEQRMRAYVEGHPRQSLDESADPFAVQRYQRDMAVALQEARNVAGRCHGVDARVVDEFLRFVSGDNARPATVTGEHEWLEGE